MSQVIEAECSCYLGDELVVVGQMSSAVDAAVGSVAARQVRLEGLGACHSDHGRSWRAVQEGTASPGRLTREAPQHTDSPPRWEMCLLRKVSRFLRYKRFGHFSSRAEETHRMYIQKLDEVSKLQDNCSSSISRQRKRLREVSHLVKKCSKGSSEEDAKTLDEVNEKMKTRLNSFFEMEAFLPKKNGLYLSLVLGNVNVTLFSKQSKFAYKDEYEKFKLYLTVLLLLFSFICYFFVSYRFFDAILNFLLLWYYCTLTIRESILITNGSRIKGWWVFHHYISAFLSGVMLTWPDGNLYKTFRNQFLAYSLYQSFVQCLQCYYQSGCLYRLRALGERHNMDLTVEGFQSWMWKGLTFLLPFLFFGHFWQLFNGLALFRMAQLPDCKEWQVLMCGLCFLILFMGNFFTTVAVVRHKVKSRNQKPKTL